MARKNEKYQKKSFESDESTSDTSSNIYMSMLMSDSWKKLSPKQQVLYMYCKAQYYGQSGRRAADSNDNTKFYFNKALWCDVYGLYTKTADARFHRDMAKLIEHGFIDCVESGKFTRTKSIYQFSDRWKYLNQI